jgi:hypothetical protein
MVHLQSQLQTLWRPDLSITETRSLTLAMIKVTRVPLTLVEIKQSLTAVVANIYPLPL